MGVNADDLIPIAAANAATVAARWSWRLERDLRPFALTPFGDLFLEDSNGEVHLLDVMEGVLRRVAPSRRAFEVELSQRTEAAREWLLLDLVELLRKRGVLLRVDQCYGWKVPPLLGAPLTTDNVDVFEIERYQVIVSTFLKALAERAPGAPVGGLTVDGEPP